MFRSQQPTIPFDMYLGQLLPIEEYRAYGFYSNMHNKIIVLLDSPALNTVGISEAVVNNNVKEAVLAIHTAFVNAIQNPFHPPGYPIVSKKFDSQINQIIRRYNSGVGNQKRK